MNKIYSPRNLITFFAILYFPTQSYSLSIPETEVSLPKVVYSKLESIGLGDSEELLLKNSIKLGLKNEETEKSLRNELDVSADIISLVKEIDLERLGIPVRLLKSKARVVAFEQVKSNWDQIKNTVINVNADPNFENFAPYLKEFLRNEMTIKYTSQKLDYIVFQARWLEVRINPKKELAFFSLKVGSNSDRNRLEPGAEDLMIKKSSNVSQ